MRLQLISLGPLALVLAPGLAPADDSVDSTTTYYTEGRDGGDPLVVIHQQVGVSVDLGDTLDLGASYAADIVSGATPSVYSVDAVSSATVFDDTRHSGGVQLGLEGRMARLAISAAVGTERDYASITLGASSTVYLPGKNSELTLAYARDFDQVCDKANADANGAFEKRALTVEACEKQLLASPRVIRGVDNPEQDGVMVDTVWRDLAIDTAQATLTQNLSPTMAMQLGVWGSVLNGYQANPYRRVQIGPVQPQETLPEIRGRVALFGRLKIFLPTPRAAVGFGLRGYADTWGVEAGSAEMSYAQYVGRALLVELRGRVHQQSQAAFFKDAFFYQTEGAAGAYYTGDRELAPLRDVLLGGKVAYARGADGDDAVWGLFDEVEFYLKAEALLFFELDAEGPGDNLAGTDDQFATGALAVLGQLGLRLRY